MYLGSYSWDGAPEDRLAAYDRLRASLPSSLLLLHVCVARSDGITVYDACPSEADFRAFSSDPAVLETMAGCGLAAPVVTPLGGVHVACGPGGRPIL